MKDGKKTSEFAFSIGAGLLGVGLAFGAIAIGQLDTMVRVAGEVSGAIVIACSALGYNVSRGLAKKKEG